MKPIEAREQVSLGPARALQLALSGMVYRFFRSGVTATILCLAVAFLVYTLISGFLAQATEHRAYQELQRQREFGGIVNRLQRPDSPAEIIAGFAKEDEKRLEEYVRWGELSSQERERAVETARLVLDVRKHFEQMSSENKAILGVDMDIAALLRRLSQPAQYELFSERIEQISVAYPLTGPEDFQLFLEEQWPWLLETVERVHNGHSIANSDLRAAYPDRDMMGLLISPPEDFRDILQEAGFEIDEVDFGELSAFAARIQDREALESILIDRRVRAEMSARLNVDSHELTSIIVFEWLLGRRGDAEWLDELLAGAGVEMAPAGLLELADYFVRSERLQAIAGSEPPEAEPGIFVMEGHLPWLLLLAFIVCMVGVANAMLMSVTERFTEIATMKCLGALDRFVMMMFVFEAGIQGLVGGFFGVLLGGGIAFGQSFIEFGTLMAFTSEMAVEVLLAGLLSIAIGIVLAAIAALGPSLIAARLAPMEAMRVE